MKADKLALQKLAKLLKVIDGHLYYNGGKEVAEAGWDSYHIVVEPKLWHASGGNGRTSLVYFKNHPEKTSTYTSSH